MKRLCAITSLAVVAACCLSAPSSAALLNLDGSPVASDPNLSLWLKADALGLNNGDPVATWAKSSDNGSDAFQGDIARQPIFTTGILNGQPVVRFDGGDFLDTTGVIPATGADPRSIVAVFNNAGDASIAYRHVVHYGTTSTNQSYGLVAKSLAGQTGGGIGVGNHYWANGFSSSQSPTADPLVVTISYDGATDRLWSNGNPMGSKAVALNTGSAQSLKIGSRIAAPSEMLLGDIAEVIVYNEALSADDRGAIEGYLSGKYGITFTPPPPPVFGINMSNFSDVSNWQLNVHAAQSGDRLRLTPTLGSQRGSAFFKDRVALPANHTFNAQFSFEIHTPGGSSDLDGQGADGMTFMVQGAGPTAIGAAGGDLAAGGISPAVMVEIDTWHGGTWDQGNVNVNGNHLAINVSGEAGSRAQTGPLDRFNDGGIHWMWVDYNGITQQMDVYLSTDGPNKPIDPVLSENIDLTAIFGDQTELYFGSTAATGGATNTHDVLSLQVIAIPEPGTWLLLGMGSLALMSRVRRRRTR